MSREIFVFGSNLRGVHAGGSALHAYKHHGAVMGEGEGLHGDSYALPTLDHNMRIMTLREIKGQVDKFLVFAKEHPDWTFNVVAIGCGIAGYVPAQIAPMFADAPDNCALSGEFKEVLEAQVA